MPKWSDFGNILSTIRELDVTAIRAEAEERCLIVCAGHDAAVAGVGELLRRGPQRYALAGPSALQSVPLSAPGGIAAAVAQANLLVLAIDGRRKLTAAEAAGFGQLEMLSVPVAIVVVYGDSLPADAPLPSYLLARTVAVPDPAAIDAPDRLAAALLDRLPAERHLAAARRLPGLRGAYARELIAATAFTNATYALASGLPEQIPLISIPFAAADIIVLTKNQALLVYRLALAYGAPPDFQARIREVLPVVGGAFLWRQAARSLIGLIPVWGLVPKVAVAYSGTYATGVAAWRWYEGGELVTRAQVERITREGLAIGRAKAAELVDKAREQAGHGARGAGALVDRAREQAAQGARGAGELVDRVRQRTPFRRRA